MRVQAERRIFCLIALVLVLSLSAMTDGTHHSSSEINDLNISFSPPSSSSPIREFNLTKNAGPEAIISAPNQVFWFTEFTAGKIGQLFNQTGKISNYTIPEPGGAQPSTLAMDSLGRIWFADEKPPGSIWVFTPSNQTFRQFNTRTSYSTPVGVLVDPANNNVWFTETNKSRIGEITSDNSVLEYSLPTANSGPALIALQTGTSFLWITESFVSKIAKFDMNTHAFQEFIPSVSLKYPVGIVADNNGNIWVSEHGGSSVTELIPSNSTFKKYPTSQASGIGATGPATIAKDKLGRLWFVEHYANKVGRLDPQTGIVDEFVIPTPGAYSLLNTVDPSANFWFTEFDSDKIGMIPYNASPPMSITPLSIGPTSITAGQTVTSHFSVTSNISSNVTVSMSVTSSFGPNGVTSKSEVSLSNSTLTLSPGQTATIIAAITPDLSLASGVYAVGVVATYANVSTAGIVFLQVQGSYLYLVESYLPEFIVAAAVIILLTFILLRKRRSTPKPSVPKSFPKVSVSMTLLLILFALMVQVISPAIAKCPGLPQPPVNPNGPAIDYYGIALDVGSITFFVLVAYFLVRSRLNKDEPQK